MAAHLPSRLYRSRSQKMIAGVSGGLGDYFDVDPVLIRLLFVVTTFISGVGILAYIVLWILVPFEGDESPRLDTLRRDFDDLSGRVREYVDPIRGGSGSGTGRGASATDTARATAGTGPTGTSTAPGSAPSATTTAETGEDSPASRSATTTTTTTTTTAAVDATGTDNDGDDLDAPIRRTFAHEEASMTSDSVTTGRLPVSDAPATTDVDPFGEALPEDRPRMSSSAPDAPYDAPAGAGTSAGSAPHDPPYGPPPPYMGAAAAAAPSDRRRRRQHWAGAILIILGLLILGNNLGLLWWIEPEFILPLILVGGGAWLLFGRGRRG